MSGTREIQRQVKHSSCLWGIHSPAGVVLSWAQLWNQQVGMWLRVTMLFMSLDPTLNYFCLDYFLLEYHIPHPRKNSALQRYSFVLLGHNCFLSINVLTRRGKMSKGKNFLTSSIMSNRALLQFSNRAFHVAVSFSSFFIFFVVYGNYSVLMLILNS